MPATEHTELSSALRDLANAKRNVNEAHAAMLIHAKDRSYVRAYHAANVRWRKTLAYCLSIGERYT